MIFNKNSMINIYLQVDNSKHTYKKYINNKEIFLKKKKKLRKLTLTNVR